MGFKRKEKIEEIILRAEIPKKKPTKIIDWADAVLPKTKNRRLLCRD
ncbi:MAG: hypothetical protein AABX75_02190 [Nanoarchaeota archaeon]